MKQLDAAAWQAAFGKLKGDPRSLAAAVGIIFIIDIFILIRLQFLPLVNTFATARRLKKDIRQAQDDAKFAASNKQSAERLKDDLATAEKRLTAEDGLPLVLESISKFADMSAVRILKIKPSGGMDAALSASAAGTSQTEQLFSRRQITATLRGGFHQIGRFVALLESSPVFLDIRKLEIQADDSEYAKQSVTIMLEVVVKKG